MSITAPPKDDTMLVRHQFYTGVAKDLENYTNGTTVIGEKLDTLNKNYLLVHDLTQHNETRNKTLIMVAIVVWSILGGGIGWYVQRAVAGNDRVIERIDIMEKKVLVLEADMTKQRELPERVDSLKRLVIETQRQLDDIELRKK